MASVLPKFKFYFYLSLICLLINMSVFATTVISGGAQDVNDFLDYDDTDDYSFEGDLPDDTNASISGFVLSAGTSFIPFFSLLPLALISDLPTIVTVFTGIMIGIISAIQVFLIAIIIMNLAPRILGSGFEV